MKRLEIVIPLPMPTWNRILVMHPMARIELRHLIHLFVSLSIIDGRDWPTWTEYRSRQQSTDLLRLVYLQMIRPSKLRKSSIARLREDLKKPKS